MLRSEMIGAINKIQGAIATTGLTDLLRTSMGHTGPGPDAAQKNPVDLYRRWVIASNEFGETERTILRILRLQALLDAEFWSAVLTARPGTSQAQQQRVGVSIRQIW